MKVIAAINGTITAESIALYALKYAQIQSLTLVLLHVENEKDELCDVDASVERIGTLASSMNIETEKAILRGSLTKMIPFLPSFLSFKHLCRYYFLWNP